MELHYNFSIFNSSHMCFICNLHINIVCFGVHPINPYVSNFLPVELSSKFQTILLYNSLFEFTQNKTTLMVAANLHIGVQKLQVI
jgi:hypothetical protein